MYIHFLHRLLELIMVILNPDSILELPQELFKKVLCFGPSQTNCIIGSRAWVPVASMSPF